MGEFLKNRFNIVTLIFLFLGLVIFVRLFDIQVIHGEEFFEKSQKRLLKEKTIPAARGRIFDSKGVPIAANRQGFCVSIIKTGLSSQELNDVALKLTQILKKNEDRYNRTFSKYMTIKPFTFGSLGTDNALKWQMDKDTFNLAADKVREDPEQFFKYLKEDKFKIDAGYSTEDAYEIMTIRYEILRNQWHFDMGRQVTLAEDVSRESVAEIEERHYELPGVTTSIMPYRQYSDASLFAHLLGYIGLIKPDQLDKLKGEGYDQNDLIGQNGIELAAESYLRGKSGKRLVEVDTKGRETAHLGEDPAKPGDDIILTVDADLQRVALESLERNINTIKNMGGRKNFGDANAGAVVALDVNSGQVLAMASYPYYDPSLFIEDASNQDAQKKIDELFKDNTAPMYNRAIQGNYAPGSTFKPVVAVAGLEEGVIGPKDTIRDKGYVNIGGKDFYCLEYNRSTGYGAHGNLTIEKALAASCNIFFHILGYRTTIDYIDKWASLFGLGKPTGIDIPFESSGILASKETKRKLHNDDWRPADTAQTAIGQFDNAFTPLQLACYVSTIANGGYRYEPYIIKRIISRSGEVIKETQPVYEKVALSKVTIDTVKKGMIAVTNSEDGTAVSIFRDFPFKVAGKTGTAETGFEANQSSNALFVCYAPADKPEIAVAVVVEKGVWGAYTAPIAKDILMAYFNKDKQDISDDINSSEEVFTR